MARYGKQREPELVENVTGTPTSSVPVEGQASYDLHLSAAMLA